MVFNRFNNPIIVLGMHRSGTSVVTNLLHAMGMSLGGDNVLLPADIANQNGYWENVPIKDVNNALLERFGSRWDYITTSKMDFWDGSCDYLIPDAYKALLTARNGKIWGWKDPRTVLTYPFWKELVHNPRILKIKRNRDDVVNSLVMRNNIPERKAKFLYDYYNGKLDEINGTLIEYDQLIDDPVSVMGVLSEFMGVKPTKEMYDIIKPSLNHHTLWN